MIDDLFDDEEMQEWCENPLVDEAIGRRVPLSVVVNEKIQQEARLEREKRNGG